MVALLDQNPRTFIYLINIILTIFGQDRAGLLQYMNLNN